jgi:prepilin peptidase CpaA
VNLVEYAPLWLIAVLGVGLAAAAIEDAVRRRISNLTCFAVFAAALIAMAIRGFPLELWQNALVFVLLLSCGTAAFAARLLGGGDVKLLAAVGLWMNLPAAVWLLAAVFISGGLLAILFILARPMRRTAGHSVGTQRSSSIPYGLAIVAGAFMIFAIQLGAFDTKPERPNPFAIVATSK